MSRVVLYLVEYLRSRGRLVFYLTSLQQETLQLAIPEEHQSAAGGRDSVRYNFTKVLDDNSTQEVCRLSGPMVGFVRGFCQHVVACTIL